MFTILIENFNNVYVSGKTFFLDFGRKILHGNLYNCLSDYWNYPTNHFVKKISNPNYIVLNKGCLIPNSYLKYLFKFKNIPDHSLFGHLQFITFYPKNLKCYVKFLHFYLPF